jgi:hypothetical protein
MALRAGIKTRLSYLVFGGILSLSINSSCHNSLRVELPEPSATATVEYFTKNFPRIEDMIDSVKFRDCVSKTTLDNLKKRYSGKNINERDYRKIIQYIADKNPNCCLE